MTKTFTFARTATLALVASAVITLAPAAHAADGDQAPQAEMNVAGTDFTSAKAVDHLITRLHRVALDICVQQGDPHALMSDDERACVNAAIKSGLAQIDSKRQEAMRETAVHVATAQPNH
jgi:UrcA family protein